MAKESKYSGDKRVIFREVFNSYDDVAKNGGTLIGTPTILNGRLKFTSSTGQYLQYLLPLYFKADNGITIRIKMSKIVSTGTLMFLISDTNTSLYLSTGGSWLASGSSTITCYQDGVAKNITFGTTPTEIILTSTDIGNFVNTEKHTLFNANNGFAQFQNTTGGEIELFEIYRGILTATEVSELYKGTLYKTFKDSSELFHINAYQGVTTNLSNPQTLPVSTSPVQVKSIRGVKYCIQLSDNRLDGILFQIPTVFSISTWIGRSINQVLGAVLIRSVSKNYLISSNNQVLRWDGSTSGSVFATGVDFASKQLTHVIITYNNGAVQFYINGVANATGNVVGGLDSTTIGISSTGSTIKNDFLNFRMFNKLISAAEATRIYWSEKTKFKIPN